ncbi:MAG: PIG-L family deacetylase [Gemmataceae bacterium]|nr:PIG-L family deacetylase [Gemmataceae bacterium]
MPTALFLSPHLDDVAFSCGGTVARLAAAGWRCVLATAFTRSVPHPTGFALACQADKGLPADVDYLALRRAEDAGACRALGAEPVWLDLPEAPHRGYGSAAELFAGVKDADDVWRPLADRLHALHREAAPDLVFTPQGLGNHVDHVQLIRAADAVRLLGAACWYRDTPYAIRDPAADPAAGVPTGPEFAVPVGAHLAAKLEACAAYRTQLGFQFGGESAMRDRLSAFALAEGGGESAERFVGRIPPTLAGRRAVWLEDATVTRTGGPRAGSGGAGGSLHDRPR